MLQDPDPMVHQMAEHAMWGVWFRSDSARGELRGSSAARRARPPRLRPGGAAHFDKAIELDPSFAEACNQRAIVHYLEERPRRLDRGTARRTVERMPCRFGAGPASATATRAGQLGEAVECYEKAAMSINPQLEGIPLAIEELRALVSGEPQ